MINALSEKFMDGPFFFYGIISESLHVTLNAVASVENELLSDGLAFVVEEGTEAARSSEEVGALKIQKLVKMLQNNETQFELLTKDRLKSC